MTLVNDLGNTLERPCERSVLGVDLCTKQNYRSWRSIAVALREVMLAVSRNPGVQPSLFSRTYDWLGKWIDRDEITGVADLATILVAVHKQSDPPIDEGERFPADPGFSDGELQPLSTELLFNSLTRDLIAYAKDGYLLYREARKAGIVAKIPSEIEQAEHRPSSWLPPWVLPVAAITAIGAAGVWVWTQILRARRGAPP